MFDLVIKNAMIVDGTGNSPYQGEIGIVGEKIVSIRDSLNGRRIIDSGGLMTAPGFIDVHAHSDTAYFFSDRLESKVFQGVTTELNGNCGFSVVPNTRTRLSELKQVMRNSYLRLDELNWDFHSLEDYAEQLSQRHFTINCAPQIGHIALRVAIMGMNHKHPNRKEMEEMKALLQRELDMGAWGMSVGLIYAPGNQSDISELKELAEVLACNGAIFSAHIRGEDERVFNAVDEIIEISRDTGVKAEISHLKVMGRNQWGKAPELLNRLNEARVRGANITWDYYPYNASSTSLWPLIPKWAQTTGYLDSTDFSPKMRKRELLEEIKKEIYKRGGPDRVFIAFASGAAAKYQNNTVEAISKTTALSPEETVLALLSQSQGKVQVIYHSIDERDSKRIMVDPTTMVGSDGYAFDYDQEPLWGRPHPRSFGTFPRFLSLAKKENLLPVEKAIRKMTKMPADRLGLDNRGTIEEGAFADLVIFDPARIRDTATYSKPFTRPEGIRDVIVAGRPVIQNGMMTEERPGKILLKTRR